MRYSSPLVLAAGCLLLCAPVLAARFSQPAAFLPAPIPLQAPVQQPVLPSTAGASAQEEQIVSAVDTARLLEIGYRRGAATVEGTVVRAYWARSTKGQPTFLDFHDPYEGYFVALIWGDERNKFPASPESYYLNKKVRVTGIIEIYRGAPEIVLREGSQIQIVN